MRRTILSLFLSLTALVSLAPASMAASHAVDPVHSMAIFKIGHLGIGNVYGRFNGLSGTFETDDQGKLTQVAITIDAASVDTNTEQRDNHLRSADFLNVAQYPEISFVSTAVEETSDNNFKVTGQFTLHGVTQEIQVLVTKSGEGNDPWGNVRVGAEAEFTISRSAYGMTGLLDTVGDEVKILLAFEGIRG